MNDLCADIGWRSINHAGEQLCGDHVDIVEQDDSSIVIVLADGLGSGVKASILSTLTSKIISTMIASGMPLEECVATIAATLPVCSVRGVAYSTFTIIHLIDNDTVEIAQFDNPQLILLRDSVNWEYPTTETEICGKKILKSVIKLRENDVMVAMSDGCTHAGIGTYYSFGWEREEIVKFVETMAPAGYTAKTLSTMLIDECGRLYDNEPGDDTTACVVRVRRREPMNMMFGPPSNREDSEKMASLFMSKGGKHIVCGGTTSSIVADFLGKKLEVSLDFTDDGVPPLAKIEGVDLVTEGVITVSKVLEYAKDYLAENVSYEHWNFGTDGASQISRMLFEEATDINFFVGRAMNPAHQNPELPINFNIKMNIVKELSECLKKMGKRIKVSYF